MAALKISEVLPKYQTFKALFPYFMDRKFLEFWHITYRIHTKKLMNTKVEWKVNFGSKLHFLGSNQIYYY